MRLHLLAALALAPGLGCGDDDDGGCAEPTFEGTASDEAWRTMVDADDQVTVGDPNGAVITAPTEDAVVPSTDASLPIEWDSALARAGAPRPAAPANEAPGIGESLRGLVEGTAWAHLPPVTGDVYWIRITVPGRACVVEGLTTSTSWDVRGDDWEAVKAATGPVTIDITSAYLTENRITEGPYRPDAPRTITIAGR